MLMFRAISKPYPRNSLVKPSQIWTRHAVLGMIGQASLGYISFAALTTVDDHQHEFSILLPSLSR